MRGLKVKDGEVIDSAIFDDLPEGWIKDEQNAGIGWVDRGDGVFTPPVKELESPLTAKEKIQVLESSITSRRLREAVLSQAGKEWLQQVENEIVELRGQI